MTDDYTSEHDGPTLDEQDALALQELLEPPVPYGRSVLSRADPARHKDPTLDEMGADAEAWRASQHGDTRPCRHCGHPGGSQPTEHQLRQFYAYLMADGQREAAENQGIAYQSFKNNLSHLYRRVGCVNAVQFAYRLGRGEWSKAGGAAGAPE